MLAAPLVLGLCLAAHAQPAPPTGPVAAPPASGGIPWFATWDSALREAARSGRPILLVSAAPHCAGVSGMW